MTVSHLVLLDNEAVQALSQPDHAKHRRVVSHMQVVARRKKQMAATQTAVPTSVRVEAGWDRTAPAAAFLNRLRVADTALDSAHADVAADIRRRMGVSIADAHMGAAVRASTATRITVITSDPDDMRAVAGSRNITIVAI